MGWVRACHVNDFKHSYCFRHRRKEIALFRLEDGIYATNNSCTHEYSPLCEGMIMDGRVYCPSHGSRFDIRSGAVIDLPATVALKTYKVKVENDEVYVKL